MSHYMKGKTKLLEFLKDGKVIGYSLAIKDESTLHGLFAGMDYEYVRQYYLLFNLYGYTVKLGIDEGAGIIEMGLTTTYEKLSFGSEVVPMYAYMKHLSPFLNPILTNLFVLFSESTKFHTKQVFNRRFCERVYTDASVVLEHKKEFFSGNLADISLTGARISFPKVLKKGRCLLRFSFSNPLNDFKVPARVVWSFDGAHEKEMGFVFILNDPAINEKVRRLVLSYENKERKIP